MSGKTFWGLKSGTWGPQTGTLATQTLSNTTSAVAAGYYDVTDLTTVDSELVKGNIKSGATIFGVAGDSNVADTSTGNALAWEILSGKKAWVNGSEVTGDMPTNTLSGASNAVSAGYYTMTNLTTVDADLATANIKSGVTIFGVAGDSSVVDTSSGTASAEDILIGETAFVNGSTITGTRYASPPALVAATMENYSSYATGDDGNLRYGVSSPSPRFTDNNNGTVTDNLTGLIWLKNAYCVGATRVWATALTDVASLNSAGTMNSNDCDDTSNGGSYQTDWRLPNRKELKSLIDASKYNPALPAGHPFTSVQASYYWSATTYASSSANAWVVRLVNGGVYNYNKTSTYYVWPVRAGQ